ncbi:magnesium transporter MRS2-4-like [Hibiscus syriacus]|uniref:Magnesium transporter MRS2-4-like n=1 Tax=Hibiscus syriacus TaxID=106335 RepID=A0A6A3D9C5_HIBSY|nr:magnesium transporter MRS2-4-like [Hibiscus syriacus]
MITAPSWTSQDARLFSFYTDVNLVKQKNRAWDSSSGAVSHPNRLPYPRENTSLQSLGSLHAPQDVEGAPSTASKKQDSAEPASLDAKASSEKKDNSHTKSPAIDGDSKHDKQQFAQRSKVRKLQCIAELERNVQALQAKGSEVSAELEFLNQQNLILSMENKALKQRYHRKKQRKISSVGERVERRVIGVRADDADRRRWNQRFSFDRYFSHRRWKIGGRSDVQKTESL